MILEEANLQVYHVRTRVDHPQCTVYFKWICKCAALEALAEDNLENVASQYVLLRLQNLGLVLVFCHVGDLALFRILSELHVYRPCQKVYPETEASTKFLSPKSTSPDLTVGFLAGPFAFTAGWY